MSVSLVEVMVAASRRLAPLSGECAGHAVLAVADQLLSNPRLIGAAEVLIEESGAVRLAGGLSSDERGCDQGLRGLLDGLLAVAHSGGAGLLRVGQRTPTGDLGQLVKELEVALIPANRAAARRSLARLHRETERARDAGRLEQMPGALPAHAIVREPAPLPPARVDADALPERTLNVDSARVPPEAQAASHGSGAVLSASELDLLAVTQVRFATGMRAEGTQAPKSASASVETDLTLDVEVDVDTSAVTPEPPVQRTQPLPEAVPRREVHETAPLPPVTTERKLRTEHETPLEPVLGRRYASSPPTSHEPTDIHRTPYLGTLVATVPYYDPEPHAPWQAETWQAPEALAVPDTSAPAAWEADDSTTDPAPVVAWSTSDEVAAEVSDEVNEPAVAAEVSDDVDEPAVAAEVSDEVDEPAVAAEAFDEFIELAEDEIMELAEDEITEIVEEAPFAACPALAVQPRVIVPLEPKPPRVPRTSDVEALLERFRIAEPEPEPQLMRGLKQLAGITATPPPVLARTEGAQATASTAAVEVARSESGAPIRPIPTVRVTG